MTESIENEEFDSSEFTLETGEPVEFFLDDKESVPDEMRFVILAVDHRYLQAEFFAKRTDGVGFNKLILRVTGEYTWDYHVRSYRGHGRSRFGMYIFWRDNEGKGEKVLPNIDVLTPNVNHGTIRYGYIQGANGHYKDNLDLLKQPDVRGFFQPRVYNSKHDHG